MPRSPARERRCYLTLWDRARRRSTGECAGDLSDEACSAAEDAEHALARQNEVLVRLNSFSMELAMLPSEEDLETFVVKRLIDVAGGVAAVFSEYDPVERTATVKHVHAESGGLERVVALLGRPLIGYRATVGDEAYKRITENPVQVTRTLHEASFESVPRPVGVAIQAMFGIDRLINIGYMVEDTLFGISTVGMAQSTPDPPEGMLESFSSMVALALRRRQVETSLRRSEERHRLLAEHASDVIWTMDIEGRLTYVSSSVERVRGFTPAEAIQQSLSTLLAPESAAVAQAALAEAAEAVRAGKPAGEFIAEFEHPRRDGSTVWMEHRITELRDSDGRWIGFLGVGREVTDRRRAQAYQEMSRDVLQVLNEPGDLASVVARVVEVLKARMGFDAVGVRLRDGEDYPFMASEGLSEDLLRTENALVAHDQSGDLCRDEEGNVQLECTCGLVLSGETDADAPFFTEGGSFWTNDAAALLDLPVDKDPRTNPRNRCVHSGYASLALVPIRDRDHIVGLIYLADHKKGRLGLEVVERLEGVAAHFGATLVRKQAEAALKESQERYETLIDLSPDAIVVDAHGTYVFANQAAARLFGAQSPDELIGRAMIDCIHPDSRGLVSERSAQVAAGAVTAPREIILLRLDGTAVEVEASAARIEFDGRKANLVVYRDVTARKQAEAERRELEHQLQERQKLESLGVLAGGIAHDFNNMLTAILGYSDMVLASGAASPAELLSDVGEIKHAAERAKALTGAILAFSRRQPREPQILSLASLVADLEPLLRRTLGEDIDLVCSLSPEASPVEVDPSQFSQVVMNLAVNARDAMPEGGTLALDVTCRHLGEGRVDISSSLGAGKWAVLSVVDTGVGMEPAVLGRIFEPFFTTKGPGAGTGLGLSTAYGIVKQSGGDIIVRSEVGRGTTFEVYLPCVDDDVAEEEGVAPASVPGILDLEAHQGGGECVLVVEDEIAVRELVTRILRERGYDVLVASDGLGAVDLAQDRSRAIDLLLTDVVLPGALQGDAVARSVQEVRPGVKVIFMSGYPRDTMTHTGRLEEGINYLEKPFTADTLTAKVRDVLGAGS